MEESQRFSEALDYHERIRPGKLEIRPTKPTATQQDLSLAYTPGVAEPCLEIHAEPDDAYRYTNRGNLVAVVSNGTAVLGLGNIGPLAGKPVMEGKAVLFKRFADIDVYDLEVDSADPADVIRFCELLEPTVGGINLEDIAAPECFQIERELKQRLAIPVFHDDQHGTAIIAAAGFLNALELTGRRIEEALVVFNGAGAAGIATARFLRHLGVRHIVMCDSRGVVYRGREAGMNPYKEEFAADTEARTLAEALVDADAFIGVSVAGAVTPEMLQAMAPRPIVFALANPDPEIPYDAAKEARGDVIMATGRSDFPNQVNNVLGFPFIFRGALDVRTTHITEGMKEAAARALAELARRPVDDGVLKAYGLDRLSFGEDYLIPKPFDPRVLWTVAPAVARAATEEGVARRPLEDVAAYADELRARFQGSYGVIRLLTVKAKAKPMTVVYPMGTDLRVVRAVRRVVDEKIAHPIVLGRQDDIRALAWSRSISLDGVEILDPMEDRTHRERYAQQYFELRDHKGVTLEDANRAVFDPNLFAVMMVRSGEADAVLGGLRSHYAETLRPALQVLPLEELRSIVSALYVMVVKGRPFFFADCAVNIDPTAEQLAEIAIATAQRARRDFDVEPRVAMISYSNFGSVRGPEVEKMRRAVLLCQEWAPDLAVDGEMHADTAVVADILESRYPFNRLGGPANVLVFPTLTAANASYQILHRLGDAETIGPILSGLSRSVHVLHRDADVGEAVNMTAIAVLDAQRKQP